MIKYLQDKLKNNSKWHHRAYLQAKEIEWAHIYHDSIRGKKWLEELPLNVGRWAGNYSFFYVLARVLSDYKPKKIIEFGLGESSKVISTFLDKEMPDSSCQHTIIEQSPDWRDAFNQRFKLSDRSEVKICKLIEKTKDGFIYNGYDNIEAAVNQKYDLYIVDGPFGGPRFSRYDIMALAKEFVPGDEFIIMLDDYQRPGERETADTLLEMFKTKNITIHKGVYTGNKSVLLLATETYKYAISL